MIDFWIGENLAQQFKRFQYFIDVEKKKCVISLTHENNIHFTFCSFAVCDFGIEEIYKLKIYHQADGSWVINWFRRGKFFLSQKRENWIKIKVNPILFGVKLLHLRITATHRIYHHTRKKIVSFDSIYLSTINSQCVRRCYSNWHSVYSNLPNELFRSGENERTARSQFNPKRYFLGWREAKVQISYQ